MPQHQQKYLSNEQPFDFPRLVEHLQQQGVIGNAQRIRHTSSYNGADLSCLYRGCQVATHYLRTRRITLMGAANHSGQRRSRKIAELAVESDDPSQTEEVFNELEQVLLDTQSSS